jgi:riboflavin biosynthesis pyrimidine reductase
MPVHWFMSTQPIGPGSPFEVCFDLDTRATSSIPEHWQKVYGGDWHAPDTGDRPYIFINFVTSRDGRVSFSTPGHVGGGDVSGFQKHDTWLMGFLRARADAVLVGDMTLQIEPEHIWNSRFICSSDAPAFEAWRSELGLRPEPVQIFLSFDGKCNPNAAVFARPDLHIVICTSQAGGANARAIPHHGRLDVLEFGENSVDLHAMMRELKTKYGIQFLLCEGGPRVYGSLLAAGLIDDEFLCLSPIVIGQTSESTRPSLVQGIAFTPENAPRSRLLSLRRAENHLFLRSRYE